MKFFTVLVSVGLFILPAIANDDITVDELKAHVTYLASDELEGRRPGTPGGELAAGYIRKEIASMGLDLLGDNGFQYFDVVMDARAGEANAFSFNGSSFKSREDFLPVSFSPDTTVTAGVSFAGYGFDFQTDSLSWNDYEGLDVTNRYVVILRGAPVGGDIVYDPYISLRKKVLVASDHGAAGVLFVSGMAFDENDDLMEISVDQARISSGLPVLHVKRTMVDSMLAAVGLRIDSLEAAIGKNKRPYSSMIPGTVTATTEVIKEYVKTENVLGLLEGSDPVLKEEYVIIGAHYDHLGMGGPGSGSRRPDTTAIHNGADDNASGVAGILEIMEKLAANRDDLRRSVLLVAFGAEEMGVLGSKYFVNNPVLDLGKAAFMFNLDMIGNFNRNEDALNIGGTGTAAGLSDLVKTITEEKGIALQESTEGHGPSDHASFYSKDIPVLFFFTGTHEFYHTPEDDTERLNFEGMKSVADLVYDFVINVANRQEPMAYQEAGPKERPEGERYRFKVTLGIMPDVSSSDNNGLRAEAVIPGRPASNAGMQKGDIITAMEGKPVTNIYDYMNRLQEFRKGQRISVDVLRDGKKQVLIVEL